MADQTFIDLFSPELAHGSYNDVFGNPLLKPGADVGVTHIVMTLVLIAIIVTLGLIARGKFTNKETAMIPEGKFSVRNFFELIFGAVLGMMTDMMGKENARRYFPLIASLAVFIFLGNLMGLVPGLAPPTSNLNTSLACSAVVFVTYNIAGFREHGIGYLKHFLGPIWFIAPLMLVIELIGHIFRPVSLAIRLAGNMTGDHMVVGMFGQLASEMLSVPFLLPVPFLFLGLLVSTIQTLVFCLLTTIYISLAVSHDSH
ncbi:F0F1 ATP synthase subunit A [Bradymonas sediminis]|uniref:ATP synthase subunit a n=1 Tax=Bradymonas sediminis TaxID=1548548 RepID=A0A2Z4FPK0_9DELT|nr:F0F1 ATP synthase subunit A [Bradymonas sediminis]AWV90564.1 ATP synthase F0 subunit A [Bradymonas sediminis]TDP72040.1 ATP synthase F0 subcomplex A subunit [Bradymonas sediminis]